MSVDDDDTLSDGPVERSSTKRRAQNGDASSIQNSGGQVAGKKLRTSKKLGKAFSDKATVRELDALLQVEKLGRLSLFDLQVNELVSRKGMGKQTAHHVGECWKHIILLMQQLASEPVEMNADISSETVPHVNGMHVPAYVVPHKFVSKMALSMPGRWFFVGSYADGCMHRHAKNGVAPATSAADGHFDVDVVLEIPNGVLHDKDYLNGRYFYKRAYYLAWLAKNLTSPSLSSHVDSVRYRFLPAERQRPVLVVEPSNHELACRFIVHVCPFPGFLQPKRFHPLQNNMRFKIGVEKAEHDELPTISTPTPMYNWMVLKDLLMEPLAQFTKVSLAAARTSASANDSDAVSKAILLTKSWLSARSMYGRVLNGFQVNMLVLYLQKVEKSVNALMSPYHCFRVLLNFLVQWQPRSQVLTFSTDESAKAYGDAFLKNSYAVLIDPVSGLFNVLQTLTESDVQFLKEEASLMLHQLDENSADPSAFQRLFLDPSSFTTMFDHKLEISATPAVYDKLKAYVENPDNNLAHYVLDIMGDYYGRIGPQAVWQVLVRALAGRCKLIWIEPRAAREIDVKNAEAVRHECVPQFNYNGPALKVWFRFDEDAHFMDSVVRGPDVQSPDAKAFRAFWGSRCKLVRFSDTSIAETVVFDSNDDASKGGGKLASLGTKRLTTARICRYILQQHFGLDEKNDLKYTGGEFYSVLQPTRISLPATTKWPHDLFNTGEECYDNLMLTYNKLVSTLRNLGSSSDKQPQLLPLQITSVIPMSAALQKLDVIAPLPAHFAALANGKDNREALFQRARYIKVPPYVPCLLSHLVLEGSGKWPDDSLDAVQRLKAAFQVQIARALRAALPRVFAGAGSDAVLVLPDAHQTILVDLHRTEGYIFSLRVVYPREAMLAKMRTLPNGMVRMMRTERSDQLELELHHKPKLGGALNGVASNNSLSFPATVRLAKRWVASQLVLGSGLQQHHHAALVSEEAVELLVASLFVGPAPFDAPRTPDVGFVRFLRLLCVHAWQAMPLIVNFGGRLGREDIEQVMARFTAQRSTLPLVFIATPFDRYASVWTRGGGAPSGGGGDSSSSVAGLVWHRVIQLAAQCLRVIESGLFAADPKLIFRPPLETFDVTIYLNARHVARRHEAVDVLMCDATEKSGKRPIPVLKYAATGAEAVHSGGNADMPLYDFDPVAYYVEELRNAYGHLALFFCDRYGGDKVLVLWKQSAFALRPFKASAVMGRKLTNDENSVGSAKNKASVAKKPSESSRKQASPATLVPNIAALMENFRLLGGELVERVEGHAERWKI